MKSRTIFVCLLILYCLGFTGCYLEDWFEGASVKSFYPKLYIGIENLENIDSISVMYESNDFYYKDIKIIGEEIKKDSEYLKNIKEVFQDAELWRNHNSYQTFGFYNVELSMSNREDISSNVYLYIKKGLDYEKYTSSFYMPGKLEQGDFYEHNTFVDIVFESESGEKITGLFTYYLSVWL